MANNSTKSLLPKSRSQAVAATTAVTFGNPTSGIHANGTGNLIGTLNRDSADVTLSVVEGVFYPYSFSEIDAASTVAIVAVFDD